MKKIIAILLLAASLSSFIDDKDVFVGKIVFRRTFSDLQGNDITEKLVPYFGREQHYFIDGKNYKSYDENGNWGQLYSYASNTYYFFNKDKTAQKVDVTQPMSQQVAVTKLDKTEKIAGYDCKSIQIETENSITIYYYNPTIRIDPKPHSNHNLGEWNKYLEATNGALDLKSVTTNKKYGYIITSVAIEVSKQALKPEDFAFPEGIQLKN